MPPAVVILPVVSATNDLPALPRNTLPEPFPCTKVFTYGAEFEMPKWLSPLASKMLKNISGIALMFEVVSVLAAPILTLPSVAVPATDSVPGIIDPPLLCMGPEETAFDPSNQNSCVLHAFAVLTMVPMFKTLAGGTKVRPPVASWQISKLIGSPATTLVSVELVAFPVRVNLKLAAVDASNIGVAEKVTVVSDPMRTSVRKVPALSEQTIPARQLKAVRCVSPTPALKIC